MSIEFRHVSFSYHKGTPLEKKVLHDISFSLAPGEWKAVVGHTGSGKSTLAQLCNALLLPDGGEILKDEKNYATLSKKELRFLRKSIGLVFQYPEQQFFAETVEEELEFAPRNWGVSPEEIKLRIEDVLKNLGFSRELLSKSPYALSGGQKRRVAIASVLTAQPDFIILDEPTSGLDVQGREELLLLLQYLCNRGMGILHITHDLDVALSWCHAILVLHQGRSVARGNPSEIVAQLEDHPVPGLILPPVAELSRLLRCRGVGVPRTNRFQDILEFYGVVP